MRVVVVLVALVTVGMAAGCGGARGGQVATVGTEVAPASLLGEAEATARVWLEDLTRIVEGAPADPDDAVRRVRAYLEANREEMIENARSLQRRQGELQGADRRAWEAEFGEYMRPAHEAWLSAVERLRRTHGRQAGEIVQIVEDFDRP